MAFVTCGQFKQSQQEQDTKIAALEECCKANAQTNQTQEEDITNLKKGVANLANQALSAEDALVDKSSNPQGGGKITVAKIKEAIGGDVKVAVKPNSGITGNGTAQSPLSLNTVRLVDASGTVHLGNILGE